MNKNIMTNKRNQRNLLRRKRRASEKKEELDPSSGNGSGNNNHEAAARAPNKSLSVPPPPPKHVKHTTFQGRQPPVVRRSAVKEDDHHRNGDSSRRSVDPPGVVNRTSSTEAWRRHQVRRSIIDFFVLPPPEQPDPDHDPSDDYFLNISNSSFFDPVGATQHSTSTSQEEALLDDSGIPLLARVSSSTSDRSDNLKSSRFKKSFLIKPDGTKKNAQEIASQYWRYFFLALSVVVLLVIRHVTGGYWALPVRLAWRFHFFLVVEIVMELLELRWASVQRWRFNRILWLVSSILHVVWYCWYAHRNAYPLNYLELPVALLAIAFVSLVMSNTSESGEKFLVYMLVIGVTLSSHVFNRVASHPCLPCASSLPDITKKFLVPRLAGPNSVASGAHVSTGVGRSLVQRYSTGISAWLLLLDNNNNDGGPLPRECGICYSEVTRFFETTAVAMRNYRLDEYEFIRKKLEESGMYDYENVESNLDAKFKAKKDVCLQDLQDSFSSTNLRIVDEWYEDLKARDIKNTKVKRFMDALVTGVSTPEGQEKLGSVVKEYLCSPSSRIGPMPSDFILNLERPRFTGESPGMDKPMNITMHKLRDIMQSSIMNKLNPDVCFLVRLANVIPEDTTILAHNLNPSKVAPEMNERDLMGGEVSFLYPALYLPMTDEDGDKDGKKGQTFEALLTLYQQLPLRDWEPTFFETKEEYLAFFRWNVEHSLQEEYKFPKWISRASSKGLLHSGNDTDSLLKQLTRDTGELVAEQFTHMSDRLALTNSTSDETLSDRAFFGTGMKHIERIKLPGDDDYGDAGPRYFESMGHSDFFRNDKMPSVEELRTMGNQFWRERKEVPLEHYKKRVVQVDYMISSHWQHRAQFEEQGSILYLDAKTRKPMGIFVAAMNRIVLPTEARLWEYAKFYHRSTELQVMAMRHVAEYHIGWANTFTTAARQTLPQQHGLRAFLKPYSTGTGSVNWVAYQMLLKDKSILERASGLERRARGFSFGHIQKLLNFTETLPMKLESKKLGGISNLTKDIPMFTEEMRLWNVHRSFAEGYINLMYPDDESLHSDRYLYRFWHHINTLGRHTDPCVCGMDSDAFFTSGRWPAFEETRTCSGLLDHKNFLMNQMDEVQRRHEWCKRHPLENMKALRSWLEDDCKATGKCPNGLSYDFHHMRVNMGLPAMNRKVLVDVITMFMNEVTIGHEMAADNVPYMVDPEYGGVRVPKTGPDGEKPLMVDVATYVFGTVISALTTIRSNPLLSEWGNLLVHWIDNKDHHGNTVLPKKRDVVKLHLKYKTDLITLSNEMMKRTLAKPRNRWTPYMNPATQASSVAV